MDEIIREFVLSEKLESLELGIHRREIPEYLSRHMAALGKQIRKNRMVLIGSLGT